MWFWLHIWTIFSVSIGIGNPNLKVEENFLKLTRLYCYFFSQWKSELDRHTSENLKVIVITTKPQYSKVSYKDVMVSIVARRGKRKGKSGINSPKLINQEKEMWILHFLSSISSSGFNSNPYRNPRMPTSSSSPSNSLKTRPRSMPLNLLKSVAKSLTRPAFTQPAALPPFRVSMTRCPSGVSNRPVWMPSLQARWSLSAVRMLWQRGRLYWSISIGGVSSWMKVAMVVAAVVSQFDS